MSDPTTTTPITPPTPLDPAIGPPTPIAAPEPGGGISGIDGTAPEPGKKLGNKDAEPYFLKEESSTDRMKARPAARQIIAATPLIDGRKIFTELEGLITGAKSTVLLAYWAFEPRTPLVSDPKRTWLRMLVDAAASGVKVRVLMNDFDPGLKPDEHAQTWMRMVLMLAEAQKSKLTADALQVIVTNHPAQIPAITMALARRDLYDTLADSFNRIPNRATRLNTYVLSPGVWDKISVDSSTTMAPRKAHESYPSWPASHHQKLAIIDGRYALTGGINITADYVDTSKHSKAADKDGFGPWHDIYVKVEGPAILEDFIANYVGLWNEGKVAMDAFAKAQAGAFKVPGRKTPPPYLAVRTTALKESDIPLDKSVPKTTLPAIPAQIRRTVSVANSSAPFFSTVRQDVLEGYEVAIRLAKDFVYMENQYLRDKRISKAILNAYDSNKALQVIIVIPSRSEEELRTKADEVTLYGAALQHEIVEELQSALGSSIGVFTMRRADKAIVYVHSKLLIVDDRFASIGSANANPRSMSMDTELDLVWYDVTGVAALRTQLWQEILGSPSDLGTWKVADYVRKWQAIAKANMTAKKSKLRGFVRRFENAKATKGFLDLSPYT
jgi:phosphatidylserine/phosphatidylglycerophosphate/cardiolipin synthase-like enzyme